MARTDLRTKGNRPCPVCQKVMILAKKGKTELDVCEEHGVWLDSRELEEILRRRRIGEATRMQMAERHGREWGKVSAYWLGELAFLFDRNTKSAHGPRPGSKASARSRSLRSE